MTETIKGLILRETPIGDYDKIMTVLTAERGRISVVAHGAKRLKSPLFTATQAFSYSELTLRSGNNHIWYLQTGDLIENFYHLRDTLESAALAGYLADVAADVALEEQEETELLRLLLNCYHCLATGAKSAEMIKAVFELRVASGAGFTPDLVACAGCGEANLPLYYFDVHGGVFRCESCFHAASAELEHDAMRESEADAIYPTGQLIALLSPSVFTAMRFVIYSRPERIFSFELKDEAMREFSSVCEKYLLCHLERGFSTLDFYHTIADSLPKP